MKIAAHRGLWTHRSEQNALPTLVAACGQGYGIETDIRDSGGRVVVSHDMPNGGETDLATLVAALAEAGGGEVALNVKADGMASLCAQLVGPIRERVYFFDMSVPDMRGYLSAGLPVYTRHSDAEPSPAYYEQAAGVWLDSLNGEWDFTDALAAHLAAGKAVAVVSPELHGRPHRGGWERLLPFKAAPGLSLCTDLFQEARDFFQ